MATVLPTIQPTLEQNLDVDTGAIRVKEVSPPAPTSPTFPKLRYVGATTGPTGFVQNNLYPFLGVIFDDSVALADETGKPARVTFTNVRVP